MGSTFFCILFFPSSEANLVKANFDYLFESESYDSWVSNTNFFDYLLIKLFSD